MGPSPVGLTLSRETRKPALCTDAYRLTQRIPFLIQINVLGLSCQHRQAGLVSVWNLLLVVLPTCLNFNLQSLLSREYSRLVFLCCFVLLMQVDPQAQEAHSGVACTASSLLACWAHGCAQSPSLGLGSQVPAQPPCASCCP